MKKILSHVTKKYRTVVHNYRMRSANKVWAKRVSDAVALFPGKAETAIAQALFNNQVQLLRTQHATVPFASYENAKTHDKTALMHFQVAIKTLMHLLPLLRLVGVQPMSGPIGLVYHLAYKAEPTQLVDKIPGDLLTSVAGTRIKLEVVKKTAEAMTRRLQARWSLEVAHDLGALHGVDIEKEIASAMAHEVAHEIFAEILSDLKTIGNAKNVFEWDATVAKHDGEPMTISEKSQVLAIRINQACSAIAHQSRRGAGNFVVVSPTILSVLQMNKNSTYVTSHETRTHGILTLAGTLNGTIEVWLNPYSTDQDVLVGYMGRNGMIDTGYVYSPYILLMPTGVVIDPATFQPMIGMMTRYGKTMFKPTETERSDSQNYYAVVKVKNFDTGSFFTLDLDDSVDTVTTSE